MNEELLDFLARWVVAGCGFSEVASDVSADGVSTASDVLTAFLFEAGRVAEPDRTGGLKADVDVDDVDGRR